MVHSRSLSTAFVPVSNLPLSHMVKTLIQYDWTLYSGLIAYKIWIHQRRLTALGAEKISHSFLGIIIEGAVAYLAAMVVFGVVGGLGHPSMIVIGVMVSLEWDLVLVVG